MKILIMKKMTKLALTSILSVSVLAACTNDTYNTSRPDVYKQSGLNQAQITTYATVISLKPITIQNDTGATNPLLTLAGTALGGLAGAQVGGGTGKVAGAIVGGLAGGYATNEVTSRVQTTKGIEFTVKTDQGQILTFAQAGDINRYHIHQRVRLITGPQGTKVDNE